MRHPGGFATWNSQPAVGPRPSRHGASLFRGPVLVIDRGASDEDALAVSGHLALGYRFARQSNDGSHRGRHHTVGRKISPSSSITPPPRVQTSAPTPDKPAIPNVRSLCLAWAEAARKETAAHDHTRRLHWPRTGIGVGAIRDRRLCSGWSVSEGSTAHGPRPHWTVKSHS